MKTSSTWNRVVYVFIVAAVLFMAVVLSAQPAGDPPLKVMKMGLGSGTVTSADGRINCGADCDENYAGTDTVVLTATAAAGSTFAGWDVDQDGEASTTPDCTANPCTLSMSVARSVRPVFDLSPAIPTITNFTPEGIQTYLTANPSVNTPARFMKALPAEFKQNWILMTRSESLQTGTAEFPRILLPSANAQFVFTVALATHNSYPGAHPNAIEYMQWDPTQKNFRFHEIVLDAIPPMDPDGDTVGEIPARARGVAPDDAKCPRCHSTRNVLNLDRSVSPPVPGPSPGTDGMRAGTVQVKNKPNWDSYDSWGGMTPFNRDRIYQGTVEAAAFRKFFNPWNWRTNDLARAIIEQLKLQPTGIPANHAITRLKGGANDGIIKFGFDTTVPVTNEPAPSGTGSTTVAYDFNGGVSAGTSVSQEGAFVTVHHSSIAGSDEGRGIRFFDALGGLAGNLNPQRIADELINHHFATGSRPIDVRPIALAISKTGCIARNSGSNTVESSVTTPLTIDLSFFNSRNGLSINEVYEDTERRVASTMLPDNRSRILPRRKADIEKLTLDRTGDVYLVSPSNGLIQQYGSTTSAGTSTTVDRLRQEVFRRSTTGFLPDSTVMGGVYVDREFYSNTEKVALYRYFLEPLGVSVDKWSMNVRGRSRAYNFADVFGTYLDVFVPELRASLLSRPVAGLTNPDDCGQLIAAINTTLSGLPPVDETPRYTDVQRIFNKNCIECHGGLDYPPYQNYGTFFDLSEDETPPAGDDRLDRPHGIASTFVTADPNTSYLYQRITSNTENCPFGLMPCGGPPLSKTDIETIRRWIVGGAPNTRGDPHIKTVDNVNYDFQSAGEFVLLRGQGLEIQARQTAVETDGPLGPNGHTGLVSCPTLNSAVAVRVGPHRITYQPNLNGRPDPDGLQLRIDGNLATMTAQGITLPTGGRIIQTTAPGGIQIEAPGGTVIVLTPGWWDHYQVWYFNIDVRNARATDGIMGAIAPGSWLPALPDGTSLGPRPTDLHQRYLDLYEKFETAWRVTDASTLFDYAPGTSTATFTIENWPAENPAGCRLPAPIEGPGRKPPLKALPLETAQQQCAAIVDANAKANCIADVMVTGEVKFAETYLRGEQIERNPLPTTPVLGFPEGFKTDVTGPVDFTWNATTDKDNDPLTYRHCVWEVKDRFTFDKCVLVPAQTTSPTRGGFFYALLVLLIGLLLLALLIWLGLKKKPVLVYVLLIAILAGVIIAFFIGRSRSRSSSATLAKNVSGLQAGKAYYWKVIVEDGKGGTVESETRRFEVK